MMKTSEFKGFYKLSPAQRLAAWSQGATPDEMQAAIDSLWNVAQWPKVGMLLSTAG